MQMIRCFAALLPALTLATGAAFPQGSGQAPKKESGKWRTVGLIAGGVGGFALAAALPDDDQNPLAFLPVLVGLTAGGATGGYLIGRAVDRRESSPVRRPDPFVKQESRNRLVEAEVRRWRSREPNEGGPGSLEQPEAVAFDGKGAAAPLSPGCVQPGEEP